MLEHLGIATLTVLEILFADPTMLEVVSTDVGAQEF
jgi:hypothetical protein